MLRVSQQSGPFLATCITAGICTLLYTGIGSTSAHAPTSTYTAEKVLCVDNPNFPRVQFSKGKVDFRHQYIPVPANPKKLKHGDTIYTGIDGFVSLLISPEQRVNVSPQSQVRVSNAIDCPALPRQKANSRLVTHTNNLHNQSGNNS